MPLRRARVGFVFAAAELLNRMREAMGPWTISGPAREVARLALADTAWQAAARRHLQAEGERLHQLLAPHGEVKATALFAALTSPHAGELHEYLARRAILTRRFDQQPLLRCGLPADEAGWQRLATALNEWNTCMKPSHLALLAATFILSSSALAEFSLKDDTGQEIRLKAPAKRIVALAPHIAESLFAAGAGDKLVGTVDYSDYPPEAKKVPRVGGYSRVDLEAVAALKPDLVLAWESGNNMPKLNCGKCKLVRHFSNL